MRRLFLILLPLALSGCGFDFLGTADKFPPACPRLVLLEDAADLTRFGPRGRDVTDLVLDGRITRVPADCKRDGNFVKTTLRIFADLTRGTASASRVASVGAVVTVTESDGGRIVDQQDYSLSGAFPPNVDRVSISSDEIALRFPVTEQKNASSYRVYVGFRLTPEELETNRKRGPR